MNSQIDIIIEELHKALKTSNFCIAGGAVRDHLLEKEPKDYDVFIFDEVLPDLSSFVDIVVATHDYEKYLVKNTIFNVISFENPGTAKEIKLQIMHTPKKPRNLGMSYNVDSINQLLDGFDWNVSLFAMDSDHTIFQRERLENIQEGKYLRLQSLANPLSTLFRGNRFCNRFGMRMHHKDIVALCQAVVDKQIRPEYKLIRYNE